MDKELGHSITIQDRKSISLTGVKKIESFDNEEFLLITTMGNIIIKGNNLEIIKLDTFQGNVSIKGTIISLNYNEKVNSDSLFTKLFK